MRQSPRAVDGASLPRTLPGAFQHPCSPPTTSGSGIGPGSAAAACDAIAPSVRSAPAPRMRPPKDKKREKPAPIRRPPRESDTRTLARQARREMTYLLLASIALGHLQRSSRVGEKDMKKSAPGKTASPSKLIDGRIRELGDWRGEMLSRLRALIHQVDPDVVEEWKWRGVPVWEHDGIICTGETYKAIVKLTFARGAALKDPARLFNSSLEGNTRRAIDIHEGDKIDAKALQALIRAAVALNTAKSAAARPVSSRKKPKR